uniref:Solute carrier family 25 member 32 n=1 Tax=Panthera leo TaxID=9689 RepID=A0A8C8X4J3_PANLE
LPRSGSQPPPQHPAARRSFADKGWSEAVSLPYSRVRVPRPESAADGGGAGTWRRTAPRLLRSLRWRDVLPCPSHASSALGSLRLVTTYLRPSRKWAGLPLRFLLLRGDRRQGGGHCIPAHLRGPGRGISEPWDYDGSGPVGIRVVGGEHDIPPRPVRESGSGRERRGSVQPRAAPARPREDPLRRYNAIKSYKTEGRADRLEATEYLVSAAEAGAMTLCITNPLWVTKTRLMLQYNGVVNSSQRQYKGMFDTLLKIYKYEGVRGLYKGFIPGLFGTSHGALQFMAYELLKLKYNQHINRLPEAQLSTVEYISVAALSKIFAVAATYPYQVVRARLQDQHMFYKGVLDVIAKTWRKEGIGGFYKGIAPNLIRVTPACCITFVVYENVSHFLLDLREEKKVS